MIETDGIDRGGHFQVCGGSPIVFRKLAFENPGKYEKYVNVRIGADKYGLLRAPRSLKLN